MATQPRRLRASDVPNVPVPNDISGYELVDGELVPVNPATRTPSRVTLELAVRFKAHVERTRSGEVYLDVWCRLGLPYDPERLRAPDVAYFSNEKLSRARGQEIFHVLPDLVAEVHSPTNRRRPGDLQRRVRDFMDAGVPLLWVIYPDAAYALVHHPDGRARMLRETEVLDGEDVLPGLEIPLGDLLSPRP